MYSMDLKSKILLWVFFLGILGSFYLIWQKSIVQKDYQVFTNEAEVGLELP